MNRFKEKKKWLKICYCKSNFMSWRSRQKCKWRALIKFNQGCLTFQHNRLGRKARNTSLTEIYKNNLEPKFVEDSPEHIFYLKIIVECPWKSAARRLLSLQPSKQILTGTHKKSLERCIGVTQRIHLLLLFVLRSRRWPWDQSVSSAAVVCPEVADEANPGKETSPTGRAVVKRCRAGGVGGSGLPCSSLLLGLKGPALFRCVGSFGDEVAPAGSVGGEWFPGLSTDVEVF